MAVEDNRGKAGLAERAEPRSKREAPLAPTGKAIVLFSDGTGNSSAKLFKTNVYRLYEALDLGPDPRGRRTQVAYYDNGVGTSSNKILAMLGGVFGWGLKRNLIHLYLFLCRNYNEGDRIYAFGFSRGAFTTRLLVAMICTQGIVQYEDERELARNVKDAYRRFASANNPDMFPWLTIVVRFMRDLMLRAMRRMRGKPWNVHPAHRPEIEFVGVWDTVAAYGGPVAEVTRAIDKWVWPLTMTDYMLNVRVKAARHALALDDERDSFMPLLWDEVHERRCADDATRPEVERERYRTRLRQVWFAGMHSDVGGGYPDDSLAYVSLNWMIGELGDRLRLLPDKALHIRTFANAFGPIHDSRQGLASYYRYQPRKITAFLHPLADDLLTMRQTLILRDPTIGEKRHRPQGLLLGCKVHESVIARIGAGTDNYAPIGLPEHLDIVADASRPSTLDTMEGDGDAVVTNLLKPGIANARAERQEAIWDFVWYRRLAYFATVVCTLLLVSFPLWMGRFEDGAPEQDSRWVLGIVLHWAADLVPGFAKPWFDAFSVRPVWFLALLGPILLSMLVSRGLEQVLRDRTRRLWWSAMDGQVADLPTRTKLRGFRNSLPYQWGLQRLKWWLAPTLVGIAMLLAIPYLTAIVWTQVRLARNEPGSAFCAAESLSLVSERHFVTGFRADSPCFDAGMSVRKGHRYRLTYLLDPVTPGGRRMWLDGGLPVAARGQGSGSFANRTVMWLAAPFRRVFPARWLEPLVEVRTLAAHGGVVVVIDRLTERGSGEGTYVGEFTPRNDGALFLFLNDAAPPFGDLRVFYGPSPRRGTNRGTAAVLVEDLDADSVRRDRVPLAQVSPGSATLLAGSAGR